MRRWFSALCVGFLSVAVASGHAVLIVPSSDDPTKATIVFSDSLQPDDRVKAESWKKLEGMKLRAIKADGTSSEIAWKQGEHSISVNAPTGTKVIQGVVDYGVYQKGDAKPMFIKFYPKAIVGSVPSDGGVTDVALQVVPSIDAGKVRFRVLLNGKPMKDAKVSVLVPTAKGDDAHSKPPATTDEAGYTQAFEAKGQYGVTARHSEAKSGEADGKKYESINHVATLVVDVK
jgi:uncharacterized GH25 family protein